MNTRINLPALPHTLLGFDNLFKQMEDELNRSTGYYNYPPHNVMVNGDNITIEIAVAGFKHPELDVTSSKGELTVCGNKEQTTVNDGNSFLHRGLAFRNFELKFRLGDIIKVSEVNLEDGILTINLEKIIPEEHKPKKLKINAK